MKVMKRAIIWCTMFGDAPRICAVLVDGGEFHKESEEGSMPPPWNSIAAPLLAGWRIEAVSATEAGDVITLTRAIGRIT